MHFVHVEDVEDFVLYMSEVDVVRFVGVEGFVDVEDVVRFVR